MQRKMTEGSVWKNVAVFFLLHLLFFRRHLTAWRIC